MMSGKSNLVIKRENVINVLEFKKLRHELSAQARVLEYF